ncbi:biotin--[acetyl-CoA-carboxylase] ligase [Brachybacterium sp. P6-10-X1]|uniref:biotin--[acetyl-CoA-carboxylase] ligase n=1 Tax=Brachybacterium sp. P6-10-X1 TaxID=1903186 RepID=UPI0020A3DF54|nr:biotin--[acetyl-CoA-carboxylase] ligase [Brachybacterium sp. P6-10-X1]
MRTVDRSDADSAVDPDSDVDPAVDPGSDAAPDPGALPTPVIHRRTRVHSTQDEAARLLGAGLDAPFAVATGEQTAGRGRLGRRFASPAGGNVYLTYVHRTSLPPQRRTWIPLVAGLAALGAVTEAVGAQGPDLGLKWPNDLHVADGRKLGGILVEGRGSDVVLIGIGLNVRGPVPDGDGAEVPGAAWLLGDGGIRRRGGGRGEAADGEAADAEGVRRRIEQHLVDALAAELGALESTTGDAEAAGSAHRYTMTCLTLGQSVRVDPLGSVGAGGARSPSLHGIARAVDGHGRLVVDLETGGRRAVDVGDVRHVRPGGPARLATGAAGGAGQEEHGT